MVPGPEAERSCLEARTVSAARAVQVEKKSTKPRRAAATDSRRKCRANGPPRTALESVAMETQELKFLFMTVLCT